MIFAKGFVVSGVRALALLYMVEIFLAPQTLLARENIQWLWFEQAPYFVGKNPRVGSGVGDELTRYFQDNLPEYEHQNIRVNTVRYNSMIQNSNVCVPVAWLSENERLYLTHTRPHALEPPAGIYIRKSNQQKFGQPNEILSLKKLLANKNLKLGALRGMEYSQEVDSLLAQNKDQDNLLIIEAPMIEINLNLLKLGRLDYLLGLPAQKKMLHDQGLAGEYRFYNIEEIPSYIPMYAHCSNDETGKKIVRILDKLLTDKRLRKSIEEYEYWYGDAGKFRQIFLDYIVHGNPNPLVKDM